LPLVGVPGCSSTLVYLLAAVLRSLLESAAAGFGWCLRSFLHRSQARYGSERPGNRSALLAIQL
jgi:hypothetical protein